MSLGTDAIHPAVSTKNRFPPPTVPLSFAPAGVLSVMGPTAFNARDEVEADGVADGVAGEMTNNFRLLEILTGLI